MRQKLLLALVLTGSLMAGACAGAPETSVAPQTPLSPEALALLIHGPSLWFTGREAGTVQVQALDLGETVPASLIARQLWTFEDNRLVRVQRFNPQNQSLGEALYSYDGAKRLIRRTERGQGPAQILEIAYDSFGRPETMALSEEGDPLTAYRIEYKAQAIRVRQTAFLDPGAPGIELYSLEYQLDAQGRPEALLEIYPDGEPGLTTYFVWGPQGLVKSDNGTATEDYRYGPAGQLVERVLTTSLGRYRFVYEPVATGP